MQDLIDKIEQLKKSLAAMKPKENPLVPALNLPTLKPLSMPSASSAPAKSKLPGVAPATGKDPKKMAEQLKNPRPVKPKVEVLKFENNGQWRVEELDKARIDDGKSPKEKAIERSGRNDRTATFTTTTQPGTIGNLMGKKPTVETSTSTGQARGSTINPATMMPGHAPNTIGPTTRSKKVVGTPAKTPVNYASKKWKFKDAPATRKSEET